MLTALFPEISEGVPAPDPLEPKGTEVRVLSITVGDENTVPVSKVPPTMVSAANPCVLFEVPGLTAPLTLLSAAGKSAASRSADAPFKVIAVVEALTCCDAVVNRTVSPVNNGDV